MLCSISVSTFARKSLRGETASDNIVLFGTSTLLQEILSARRAIPVVYDIHNSARMLRLHIYSSRCAMSDK